jgi:hypothetical protein
VIVTVSLLLVVGLALAWRDFFVSSAVVSFVAWRGLGILAGILAEQPLPPEHVLKRRSAHRIPQKTPLRWHGTLQGELSRLPWGYGLEISLSGVEMAEGYLPGSGGMRISFTPKDGHPGLPELHAGDEISALAEYRERTILLPGDAERQVEYQILNETTFLHADVLNVGHHGSRNSTMRESLGAVAPQISVISEGEENPYGHAVPSFWNGWKRAEHGSSEPTRIGRCKS